MAVEKRTEQLHVRFTRTERLRLIRAAEWHMRKPADYIRVAVLEQIAKDDANRTDLPGYNYLPAKTPSELDSDRELDEKEMSDARSTRYPSSLCKSLAD